jgi:ATP-dependent Zn protease
VSAHRVWRPSFEDVLTAAHESAHTVLALATGARVPVVTIAPTESSDGFVILHRDVTSTGGRRHARAPRTDRRREALLEAQVAVAGRAGEHLVCGWPQVSADPYWFDERAP